MLKPAELLAVARLLSAPSTPPPSEAQLRRAISTAYYAVFHKVLRAGAERFMGAGTGPGGGFALIYRSFNHGRMKAVCESLTAQRLSATVKHQLGRASVSQEMRDFATGFVTLQELRHQADYDPASQFPPSMVGSIVDVADVAMTAFDGAPADEQADVLALMLMNPRG